MERSNATDCIRKTFYGENLPCFLHLVIPPILVNDETKTLDNSNIHNF
jgi:hypothetical protein